MDVKSLYTNIPNNEGISAVQSVLNRQNSNYISKNDSYTKQFSSFVFNNHFFLQVKECAMGTKCAPTYANIVMGMFGETYIFRNQRKIFTILKILTQREQLLG